MSGAGAAAGGTDPGARHSYTLYHPKWYRPRMSIWWWLQRASYTRFIVRELTSVAVAFLALVLLWQVRALGEGPAAHADATARLATPPFVAVTLLGLLLLLYHTITWFNAAPAAIVVRVRGVRLSNAAVAGAHYAAWIAASGFVAWILLGGGR